ncbi:MAG: hypothetical protein WA741_01810 [Candidatus Sulfotelmatobacter sp.]
MKLRRVMFSAFLVTALSLLSKAQSLTDSGESSGTIAATTSAQLDLTYMRPTTKMKLHRYVFETFGPYPIVAAAIEAGIDQADNTPREWKQGAAGHGKRFASDFGINAVAITTRYALARAFREDTLYYCCECKGVFPRLGHVVVSTFTGRRGTDGHRVFSFPALVAPYAGTMTAVYGWYPDRYSAKDAFRMGNYSLLGYVGENIALEFLYSGPHSLLFRMHVNNGHGAQDPSATP